ncbi:Kinase D-interacting substrate [Chionoecetes opilio]|uniref:Kinase D-interacting substrate n=1 Tax=Chionoecetes opilio TaxID=41210 RepID=A0A8J4XKS4_CHIOP|nr:Kinase D-interacting substrate [Chionoecetes opilio]
MEPREEKEPCQCPEDCGEVLPKEMYLAAKHGQLKKVKEYLKKGHNVNACDEDSCSLLASACIAGHLLVVRFLHRIPQLHRNVSDWSGDTPLMHAARMGHKAVVEELLSSPHPCRLNVDVLNNYKDKAEKIALASSNADIARLIHNTQLPQLEWHPDLCHALVLPVRHPASEVSPGFTFECNVCLDEYNTKERRPRSLSCGHSICTHCISLMLEQRRVTCPLCRNVHAKRVNRATDIPVNFAIDEILQEQQQVP